MEISVQYYIVAFVDLLGQRAQMEGLLRIPPTSDGEDRREYERRIRPPLDAVRFLQKNLELYAASPNQWHQTEMPRIEPELAERLQRFRITDIRSQRFADGLVLFCPLSEETHYPLGSIWSLLRSCASMMIDGLAQGFAFRAGIALGAGYTSEEGDIYGPVVAEAYRLESEVAVYPRIVISGFLANWFASFDREPYPSDEDKRVALALRDQCQNLVMEDKDGILAIDFLKATTLQSLEGSGGLQEKIREMCDSVDRKIETYRDYPKVLAKYVWVRDYIRSRIKEDGGTQGIG